MVKYLYILCLVKGILWEGKHLKNMKKLGFVCAWEKDKQKSWSGTNWGLYTALQKHYEVIDVDTGESEKRSTVLYRGTRKIKRMLGLSAPDMSLSRMESLEPKIESMLKSADYPLFQFEELPKAYNGDQYIYIDLHAGFVKKLFDTDKKTFALSAYQDVPQKNIYARTAQQDEFFEHAAGIFTMGHWLKKELVDTYGISEDKVFSVGGGY